MTAPDKLKKRKIAVTSVGKSSLVKQYIENHFVESYFPTIERSYTKIVKYNGVDYECEIIDTAGQDEYSPLGAQHAIGIHGYVLVYSITSRNSFDMIEILYDKIIDFCGVTEIPCVIVGSKCDLSSNRQVDKMNGQKLADDNKCAFEETSAKENVNVGRVFELCLAQIEKSLPGGQTEPPPTKPCYIM